MEDREYFTSIKVIPCGRYEDGQVMDADIVLSNGEQYHINHDSEAWDFVMWITAQIVVEEMKKTG